jgi:EAL domain-containing protein (putative c-di-GMP-specific phosphodiesterase class I)
MRVLLVDDNELILDTYASMLRGAGFETHTAATAAQALERLRSEEYDVVVSDIQMPEMSGLDFLKGVREVDLDVPVVLMTGDPTVDTAAAAVEYGAFRYLMKPVRRELLEEVVQRAARYNALARLKRHALALATGAAHGGREGAELQFETAVERAWLAFHPIVNSRERQVYAYELLLRSDAPNLARPQELIAAAEQLGRLPDLGRMIRTLAAEALARLPDGVHLFVNLHASDLNDPALLEEDNPLIAVAPRIVFEITERTSLDSVLTLPRKVAALRAHGFRLAVDDLGAGYSGLTSLAQLEPEFVKLDLTLAHDIHRRPTQRKLVRSMTALCRELGKDVIAEGIETAAERDVLLEVGCDLLQGFLFASPARVPPPVLW